MSIPIQEKPHKIERKQSSNYKFTDVIINRLNAHQINLESGTISHCNGKYSYYKVEMHTNEIDVETKLERILRYNSYICSRLLFRKKDRDITPKKCIEACTTRPTYNYDWKERDTAIVFFIRGEGDTIFDGTGLISLLFDLTGLRTIMISPITNRLKVMGKEWHDHH